MEKSASGYSLEGKQSQLPNGEEAVDGTFPLHKAAFQGNHRELVTLLRNGYDVAKKDPHGKCKTLPLGVFAMHILKQCSIPKRMNVFSKNLGFKVKSYGEM